ncbi:hypothetical protein NQ314_007703 [Rhamnusium bicolor]|uniref:DDE Tnp4 domain-containing protein n=1 Tax=Rhamnusium bicolor TaxID=1586634 RepID=A0AAV8YI63_9CUCU|nr:hypothetical protein NQ314_007703 [Rhamnusium bicolor]
MSDIEESSSSSYESIGSSDDEEYLNMLEERVIPKNEHYLEHTVPQYNDGEFIQHFRVSRQVANKIGDGFKNSEYFKYQSGSNDKISAISQVLIFLWFAGHQTSSFRDVGDRFNLSISSVYRIIRRLIYFLSNKAPEIIKWPNAKEKQDIERDFRKKQFPGVIGAIDGSHVKIDKPQNDPDSYLNHKHFFSIQLQVVCDNKKKIRDIFVGYPGSVCDSRVFGTSPLSDTLAEKCGDYYILGDSGYPCLRHLLTPYKDRGQLTTVQRNYNYKLSSVRYKIKHCFDLLKQKFRQLYHVKLRKIGDIVNFIRACCVLHNLAIDDNFTYEENAEVNLANALPEVPYNEEEVERVDLDGIIYRNFVANNVL